jgi:hypothetical protein
MRETIVPYDRFLEVRERRLRVRAEIAELGIDAPDGVRGEHGPAVIDVDVLSDDLCDTRVWRADDWSK